ncbi:MAG: DNA methyltransferase [Deltaproteobacteria bacterium]
MPEMAPAAMEVLAASVRRLRTLLEQDLATQLDRRFRLAVPSGQAGLDAKGQASRARWERWISERSRARAHTSKVPEALVCDEVRKLAESEMAARLLLQLVLLRQLEAAHVSRPAVLTGGWGSKGFLEFRDHAPGLTEGEYEGFDTLLGFLFDELAVDLPGLYDRHPLAPYFALSPAALQEVVAALNTPELESAWQDDTTLGWVYQFWNDPRREAIDERVGPRGKIEVHEIASKTQLFTESYMVEWLLQNSLGRIALGMRERRASSGSSLGRAAPPWPMLVRRAAEIHPSGLPRQLSELKILDPACGSGHFLTGAFDLLVPLYREEARDAGTEMTDAEIADKILRHNLHGVDIDSRAVQVAAAVLVLKARRLTRGGRIPPLNLVATAFDLDGLQEDDPAFEALAAALPGRPQDVGELVKALRYVSFRGSLMRFGRQSVASPELFEGLHSSEPLERFLEKHTAADDLGVRFDGTQLAAGLRLRALLCEGRYDVVVLNPPYLATSKIDLPPDVLAEAFDDAPDLFAAFVDRAFELCKPTGLIAFVALSNWMFLSTFRGVRERMLGGSILLLADLGKGAFRRASKLIQTAMVVVSPAPALNGSSLAARIGSRDSISALQTFELAQALEDPANYQPFEPALFSRIEGAPLLFWLDPAFMRRYAEVPKIGEVANCVGGIATTNNDRFLRALWEVSPRLMKAARAADPSADHSPYIKGAEGREWLEPCRWLLRSKRAGLELRVLVPTLRLDRPKELGVAYTTIGQRFGTRLHTVPSVRDVSGASVFASSTASVEGLVCALNRRGARELASALNPTINFQLGDVRRLPFDAVEDAAEIVRVLREEFAAAERGSELSAEYRAPEANAWAAAQVWAQEAVDRAPGMPLPAADFVQENLAAWRRVSHAVGVALGRFCSPGGLAESAPEAALAAGILFLGRDAFGSLNEVACQPLRETWNEVGEQVGRGDDLATYLKRSFSSEHKRLYEGKPIYFPLSSAKRSYVAFLSVHAWRSDTLSVLLGDHLLPEKRRVEGELLDLREARQSATQQASAERRFAEAQKLLEELNDFIAKVTEIAEQGPPRPDDKTLGRESDARYVMDLDDGVMVNSAALWPLLEPQWKEPKKWWKDLANAQGKKDYDWSRLAARYFPTRVRNKCHQDASLAVAHQCFWELHPAQAYAWELRLQDEIGPGFTIDEPASDNMRTKFIYAHAREAAEILATEMKRRERKATRAEDEGSAGPLFDAILGEPEETTDG